MQQSIHPFTAAAEVPAADVLGASQNWQPMDPADMRWVQAGCPSPHISYAAAPLEAETLIRWGAGIELMSGAAAMLQIGSPLLWSIFGAAGLMLFLAGYYPLQGPEQPCPPPKITP